MVFILYVHIVMLSPVLLEAAFDWGMWKWKGPGKDKPISTYVVRPILFAAAVWVTMVLDDARWWEALLVITTYFILFFPLVINLILKQKMCYLGTSTYDKFVAKFLWFCPMRMFAFAWLACLALCIYYYYELMFHIPLLLK